MIYIERFVAASNGGGNYNIWERGTGLISAQIIGSGSDASGPYSIAAGFNSIAQGDNSTSIGVSCIARGTAALALGIISEANGTNAVAIGANALADGSNAIALGGTAAANTSFAVIGGIVYFGANGSIALGQGTTVSAVNSAAIGFLAVADGFRSIAIGNQVRTTEPQALATGYTSIANVYGSHAHSAGVFNSYGDCQTIKFAFYGITTTKGPNALSIDGGARQWIINEGEYYCVQIKGLGVRQGGGGLGAVGDSFEIIMGATVYRNAGGNATIDNLSNIYQNFIGIGASWMFTMAVTNPDQVFIEVQSDDDTVVVYWNFEITATKIKLP